MPVCTSLYSVPIKPGERRRWHPSATDLLAPTGPWNLTLHSATSSKDALLFLDDRRGNYNPPNLCVVVIDCHPSQTTSKEVFEAVKANETAIPVVVETSGALEPSAREFATELTDVVTEKPIEPEGYIECVRSLILETKSE